jgi:hypothetical protein
VFFEYSEKEWTGERVSGYVHALAHVHEAVGSGIGLNYNTAAAPATIASETKDADSTAAVFGRHVRTAPDVDPKVAAN